MSRKEALNNAEPSKLKSLFGQDEESPAKPDTSTDRPNTRVDSSRTPSAMISFLGSLLGADFDLYYLLHIWCTKSAS